MQNLLKFLLLLHLHLKRLVTLVLEKLLDLQSTVQVLDINLLHSLIVSVVFLAQLNLIKKEIKYTVKNTIQFSPHTRLEELFITSIHYLLRNYTEGT